MEGTIPLSALVLELYDLLYRLISNLVTKISSLTLTASCSPLDHHLPNDPRGCGASVPYDIFELRSCEMKFAMIWGQRGR